DSPKPLNWMTIVPVGGGPAREISMPVPFSAISNEVRWSPDAKSILYVDRRNGAANVWSYPLGGGPARQITHFDSDKIFAYDVSPEGKVFLARGRISANVALIHLAH